MQGTSALVVGAVLVGLLLIIAAVMVVQESKSRFEERPPEYVIEDAVRFVHTRLDPESSGRLGVGGVRRVLEWQVSFLQQLAKEDKQVPIVIGTTEGTVTFVVDRLTKQGHVMDPADVAAVLELQGAYLMSIGAVGDRADEVFE